jgi:hypothetical protein
VPGLFTAGPDARRERICHLSVPFLDGLLIFGVGAALFAIVETEKQIRLRARAMRAM